MERSKIIDIVRKLLIETGISRRFKYHDYDKIKKNKEYGLVLLKSILKEIPKYKKAILDDDYYLRMLRLKMEYMCLSEKRKLIFIESRRNKTHEKLLKIEKYIKILMDDKPNKDDYIITLMKKTMIIRELNRLNIRGLYRKDGFYDYELPVINNVINKVESNILKNRDFLLQYTRTKIRYLSIEDEEERNDFIIKKQNQLLTNLKELKEKLKVYEQIIINKKNRVSTTF